LLHPLCTKKITSLRYFDRKRKEKKLAPENERHEVSVEFFTQTTKTY